MPKTYEELSSLYKGKSIALGKAKKRIARLRDMLKDKAAQNMSLRSNIENAEAEIRRLRRIASDHEDECVKYHNQLNTATDTIADQDKLIEELNRQVNDYAEITATQQKRIEHLDEQAQEFRELWHEWMSKSHRHDDHWRALSDTAFQSIGHVQKTLDLITTSLVNVNSKFKEE